MLCNALPVENLMENYTLKFKTPQKAIRMAVRMRQRFQIGLTA